MIGKVQRGGDPGGLVAYLFGPGKHNEHTDQHVVAHWTGLPGEVVAVGGDGQPELGPLVADLKADLRVAGRLGAPGCVWHCSVAIPAGDGTLSDGQWREVAEAVAEAVGMEDTGAGAVRWVAVRHGRSAAGNDHIHIVATMAGRAQSGDVVPRTFPNDYKAVRGVCNRFEKEWGLTVTGAGTGAAHRAPNRAETEIAARRGLRTEQRVHLERAVRSAAVASGGPAEFSARLAAEGITVTFSRESEQRPGTYLGVTFHTDDYTNAAGVPVAFSGRTLARDLSAPALQARWDARPTATPGGPAEDAMRGLVDALAAAAHGASGAQLAALRGQIAAGADALWAAADVAEADRGGVWHTAAGEAARAAREPGAVDRTAAGQVSAAALAVGMLPPAVDEDDAELRRAWSLFVRMLRAWARTDSGEAARVAASTVGTVTALTSATPARRRNTQPATPTTGATTSATRRRARPGDGPNTITRSGA